MTEKVSAVFVELDCVLDTRLATIYKDFGASVAEQALKSNYMSRTVDKFPTIAYDDFQKAYSLRNKLTLKDALKTPLTRMIQEFVLGTFANNTNTPFHQVAKIIVNIYPYELNEDEVRLIRDIFVTVTKGKADVEVVRMTISEITPQYLKEEVSLIVMYDYHLWLEAQSVNGNFKRQACPEIGLMAPMMFKKYPITNEDKKIIKGIDTPLFDYIAKTIAPFIRPVFIPIEHFSADKQLVKGV